MYKYILLDLDGTLSASKEGIFNCVRYALERMGYPVPEESVLTKFIGPPLQESYMEFCGMTREEAARGVELYRERYTPIGQYENTVAPGMPELCRRLKERGYVLAVASSKPEAMCISICERFGMAENMSTIAGGPSEGREWGKADVIREVFRRLGITEAERHQVLMVGDRKFDVLGAKECGIDCVGVEFFGYAPPGELADHGAVAVAQTPEQLEEFILTH